MQRRPQNTENETVAESFSEVRENNFMYVSLSIAQSWDVAISMLLFFVSRPCEWNVEVHLQSRERPGE